jgi:hypothetical protein
LRRNDNWITSTPAVLDALATVPAPLVIDLGYGATPVTTVELAGRVHARVPDARILGLEIDPKRVAASAGAAEPPRIDFAVGGFEFAGNRPQLVRAMNVLRQYSEADAAAAWRTMITGLAPGGVLVEGTCDELGRIGSWVLLDTAGPVSLTLSCAPDRLDRPATLAERLPKSLIHHNIPGEPVHRLIADLDRSWAAAAGVGVFSADQRWAAAVAGLTGWDVRSTRREHRRGLLTVPWADIAPG